MKGRGLYTTDIGSLPVQGNIGVFLAGASASFKPDLYTSTNTCGSNCDISGPASFGIQDFGFRASSDNASHTLDTFKSARVADFTRGSSSEYGCRAAAPAQVPGPNGTCVSVVNLAGPEGAREPLGFLNSSSLRN